MLLVFLFVISHSSLVPNTSKDQGIFVVTSNGGSVSDYYFKFITDQAFEAGHYLKIVFPSQYDDIALGSTSCYIDSTLSTCAQESTNTVSVTLAENLSANTRFTLKVPEIQNPSETTTSYFQLYIESADSDQILDINDAFATLYITPQAAEATGTVSFSTSVVGESAEMTVAVTLQTGLSAGSVFQVSIPDDFVFESSDCEVKAFSDAVEAVSGDFYCEEAYGFIYVYGLDEDLEAGQGVSFLFYVTNPGFIMSEGDGEISFRTVVMDSSNVIDLASMDSPAIEAGSFSDASLSVLNSYTKLVSGDLVYVTLSFTTSHAIEEDGSITVDYGTPITSSKCVVTAGLSADSSSSYYQCSTSGNIATLSSFSSISSDTTITIINQVQIASVASITLTSLDSDSITIDTDTSLSITLASQTKLTTLAFASTIGTDRKGSFTLAITSASYTSKDIKIYLPSSFSYTGTLTCKSTTPSIQTFTCSYSNDIITISSATVDCSSSCDLVIDTSTSGNWVFPSVQSSAVNIYEVSVLIDTEFATVSADIETSEFSAYSLSILTEASVFSPVLVEFTLNNDLDSQYSPYFELSFTGFDSDLGTGLSSSSSISCLTSLTAAEGSSITCVLLTSSGTVIRIEGFESIDSGTEVTIKLVVKTGSSSGTINVESGIVQYNELTTVMDEYEFPAVTFSAAATDWTLITSAEVDESTIYEETSLSITLKPSSTSSANDMLFVIFPVGWDLSASTAKLSSSSLTVTILSNAYAPGLLIYLSSSTLSSASSSTFTVTLTNGPYTGAGAGNIYVALVKNSDWSVTNYKALDDGSTDITFSGATQAIFSYADYELTNTKQANGDVLYKFFITTNHSIPSTGSLEIVFPGTFDVTYSYCSFSSIFPSDTTCTITSPKVVITNFDAIDASTELYVKVFNLINPDDTTTGSIVIRSIYTSGSTDYIDVYTLDATELEDAGYTYNTTFEYYSFYPGSVSSYGQLYLNVYMDSSVPKGGILTIGFPETVTLPAITDSNCFFNLRFKSCESSSNSILIEPVTTFPAGISMELMVTGVSVSSNSTVPVSVTSTYAGLTLSETADDVDSSAYFVTYSSSPDSFEGDLSVSPTNLADSALYNFSIPSSIETTDELVIWFPSAFPVFIGQVYCESSASQRVDEVVDCETMVYKAVKMTGLEGSDFYVNVYGVNNPGQTGDSGNILVQIVDSEGLVKSYGYYSFTASSLPSGILIKSIELASYDVNEVTDYTFITQVDVLPSEIWVDLPYEFNNEAFGIGEYYTCNSSLVDESFENEELWIESISCGNFIKNRITLYTQGSGSVSGKYLKFVISGLKSPSLVGESHFFSVFLVDSQNQVLSKTYQHDENSRVTYTLSRQSFIVSNSQSLFTMNSGVSQQFSIYTTSSKVLAKEDVKFTYSIISKNPTDGVSISPSSITLSKGESSVSFTIEVSASVDPGVFIIKWSTSSERYIQPKWSCLTIDDDITYTISVRNIPEMVKGFTTVPLTVTTSAAPASDLTIVPTANSGFTFSDIVLQSGSFETTYTISIDSTVVGGSYILDFELEGDNSAAFVLDFSSVIVIVNDYDTISPSIVSFVVNSPRHKTYLDMTLQASESCMFYYNVGPRGTRPPTNSTLIENGNKVDGYYLGYVDATYEYSFQVSGLQGEYDYVLYGLLGDTAGNFISAIFTINLFTEDLDDSILFTLGFSQPYPTEAQMKGSVISALSYQFVTETSRIIYSESTKSTATYKLLSTALNDYPSPMNIIRYTAIVSEINSLLTGIQLDSEFDIDDSIEAIDNNRPVWMVYPEINSTTKDSVLIDFALEEDGTIFVQIIADNDTVPSSRQVVSEVDAYGDPAADSNKDEVKGGKYLTLTISGLTPTSSYTLVMSAQNNKDPNRYMSDELMAVIDFITQAGTIDEGNSTSSNSLLLMVSLAALLIV